MPKNDEPETTSTKTAGFQLRSIKSQGRLSGIISVFFIIILMYKLGPITYSFAQTITTNMASEYTYSGNVFVLPHRSARSSQIQILTFDTPQQYGPLVYVAFDGDIRIGLRLYDSAGHLTGKVLLLGDDSVAHKIIQSSSFINVRKAIIRDALSAERTAASKDIRQHKDDFNAKDSLGSTFRLTADGIFAEIKSDHLFSDNEQDYLDSQLLLPRVISIYKQSELPIKFSILIPESSLSPNGDPSFGFSGTQSFLAPGTGFAIDNKEIVFKTAHTVVSFPADLDAEQIKTCRYFISYSEYRLIVMRAIESAKKAIPPGYSVGGFDRFDLQHAIPQALRAFINSPSRGGLDGCKLNPG